ncbi:hypothetical protein Ahy_B04g073077 [Arachis hypogaea]|uniref:ABC transmembrane type-1 domain-containing protein n=1 Tax=Arachis hypogaea TaxID=3818 RepID=A0A444ZPL1_ARAHY|nr:hypothetical protein Ahy_B04g073077 [Arachis hypogaea]
MAISKNSRNIWILWQFWSVPIFSGDISSNDSSPAAISSGDVTSSFLSFPSHVSSSPKSQCLPFVLDQKGWLASFRSFARIHREWFHCFHSKINNNSKNKKSYYNFLQFLVHKEISFFNVTRTGELLSRLSEDTQVIKNATTTNLLEAMRNLATALTGLSFMFATSWKHFLRELSHKTQAAAAVASLIAEKVVRLFSGGLNAAPTLSIIIWDLLYLLYLLYIFC